MKKLAWFYLILMIVSLFACLLDGVPISIVFQIWGYMWVIVTGAFALFIIFSKK